MKSKLTIKSFYDYVFADKAAVDSRFPAEIRAKKEEEKRGDFAKLLEGPYLSLIFRIVLRQLKAELLEKLLFNNTTEALQEAQFQRYHFPSEEKLHKIFTDLDNQYGFFAENLEEAFQHFVVFFKACKLQADYIEQNNDIYNYNNVPSLHAYKMLVLFGFDIKIKNNPFRLVEKFLNTHDCYSQACPLHDSLVLDLPNQTETKLKSLEAWQLFIQTYGIKALSLFQMAPAIEELLQRAPSNLQEAIEAAGICSYKRYEEYPELADLCLHYHVKEQVFNQCVVIEANRKISDNLPAITILGEDLGFPDYCFVKLPVQDPRAYILGQITNCCQSIGGDSERCVIDGITKENNGFYVLVKRHKKALISSPLLENGCINYQHFSIVGQAYAWLTFAGNLTFDSWENLRETDDAIAVQFLKKFSQDVTELTDILLVTIGCGGKTPEILKASTKVNKPEKMLDGQAYSDSKTQTMLYLNGVKLTAIIQELLKKHRYELPVSVLEIRQFIYDHDIFSSRLLEVFFNFISQSNSAIFKVLQTLTQEKDNKKFGILYLDYLFEKENILEKELETMAVLVEESILKESISKVVREYLKRSDKIKKQLPLLRQRGLYTKNNFWFLEENTPFTTLPFQEKILAFLQSTVSDEIWGKFLQADDYLKKLLCFLQKSCLLTDKNCQLIEDLRQNSSIYCYTSYNSDISILVDILITLDTLVTQEILELLVEISRRPENLNYMYLILVHMKQNSLLTVANLSAIFTAKNFLYGLHNDFIKLSEHHLLDSTHFPILIEAYQSERLAYNLANAWIALHEKNLLNDVNRSRIMMLRDLSYAPSYANGMIKLHEHGLLNETNTEIIKRHLNLGAEAHIAALIRLNSLKILTKDLSLLLYKTDTLYLASFIREIVHLKEHNIFNPHTCQFVYKSHYNIFFDLHKLYEIGFITEENQEKMLKKIQQSKILTGISELSYKSLLTEKNIHLLLTYPKQQYAIVYLLVLLKKTGFSFDPVLKDSLAHFECIYSALDILNQHHPLQNFKEKELLLIIQNIAKLQEVKLFSLEVFKQSMKQKSSASVIVSPGVTEPHASASGVLRSPLPDDRGSIMPLQLNMDAEQLALNNEYLKDAIKSIQTSQPNTTEPRPSGSGDFILRGKALLAVIPGEAMIESQNSILNNLFQSTASLLLQASYDHFSELKTARNPTATQRFFAINNPGEWQEKVYQLRMEAWVTLLICLKTSADDEHKLSILEEALAAPLFKEHRSNYLLTGAFGDTYTVRMIRELKDRVLCHQKGEESFNTFGIY